MNSQQALAAVTTALVTLADNGGAMPSGHLYAALGLQSTHDLETIYMVMEQCFPTGALISRRGHIVTLAEAGVKMLTK